MTESEWLGCTNLIEMFRYLRYGQFAYRKGRLFSCACVRRVLDCLTDDRARSAVEVVEDFEDGRVTVGELHATLRITGKTGSNSAAHLASEEPLIVAHSAIADLERSKIHKYRADVEGTAQCHLLRCVFGNPFRTCTLDHAWLTPTVTNLAIAAYEARALPSGELDTARLAVLADALEEVGCDNHDILQHLRSPGMHVRGCWPLDLLLGKGRTKLKGHPIML